MLRSTADMDLLPVAQIVKSYDVTGEVVIRLSNDILEDHDFEKEPVFICFDGLPVPFFIVSFKAKGSSGAIVRFETVNDFSHSEELVKKEIFVDASTLDPEDMDLDDEKALAAFLMGMKVKDQNGKEAGKITDYYNYPNNPCIELNGKDLVPFHEDLILKLDPRKRILQLSIPKGLLED